MKSRQIALALPLSAGFHEEILQGIARFAEQRGSWTFVMAPETYYMSVLELKGWPGDGVIADVFSQKEARAARTLGIPVVNLSGALADARLPRVMNDQRAIGRLAAEHLLECGVRRFAYYGIKGVWYARRRGEGFRRRLEEAGHECVVLEAAQAFGKARHWHYWLDELRRWLRTMQPPLGVMAASDIRARMVIDACRQVGLYVPHDVAVIGVDNDSFVCEVSRPTLTSVARNAREIGYRAAQLLDRLMSGRRPPKHDRIVPPAGVAARESTDIVPIDDLNLSRAVRFIREHIGQSFSVADLVRGVSVSRRWLEYRFQQHFGRSPHEYISEARVDRVKHLLAEAKHGSLEQVAKACGFSDTRNLRLVFRRLTGMSPSEYRRSHLGIGVAPRAFDS
jgi:LacI family transcriptional regulator